MSDGDSPRRNPRLLLGLVLGGGVVLGLIGLYALRSPAVQTHRDAGKSNRQEQNYIAQVRTQLARQTDLPTCRNVIQLLNLHVQRARDPLPGMEESAAARLRSTFGLGEGDLTEISSTSFTPLDAYYLDSCFLLRDAARSLEIPPLSGIDKKVVRQSPLDRALAGFHWVVREVRLADLQETEASEQAPPVAVLRRGVGSPLQRALVFLALLEQFGLDENDSPGLQGCLVNVADDKGNLRLWACGVALGNHPDNLYLFDPRVGLPIPGPGGKGVATLAQVRADPAVLGQWNFHKFNYDVTCEQAKRSSAMVVVSLSALAPRMLVLQDHWLRERKLKDQPLPSPVRVHLAEDPGKAQALIREALGKSGGKGEDVTVWRPGAGLLRGFVPAAEGGSDGSGSTEPTQRALRFYLNAVPQEEYPRVLTQAVDLRTPLGLQLFQIYSAPFRRALIDPNSPREMLLRGRFARAAPELVREQEQMQQLRQRRQQAGNLDPAAARWIVEEAIPAYAELNRSRGTANEPAAAERVAALWQWKNGDPIEILVRGSAAGPRGAEVAYQLALCKHEQAVRSQLRIDLGATIGLPLPAEAKMAQQFWLDAEGLWKEFLDNNANRPGLAFAQRLRGEALVALGKRAEASKIWNDTTARQPALERLARLWLAGQRGKP